MGQKDCGEVTGANACGETQTIDCGRCFGVDICGGQGIPNVCTQCTHPSVQPDCSGGWCRIPAGCFEMGVAVGAQCTPVEPAPYTLYGAETLHEVALTHSFEMMDAEVTQDTFKALMGYLPSKNRSQPSPLPVGLPVEYVSWHEAAAFANALSRDKGLSPCHSCSGADRFVTCTPAFDGGRIYDCQGYRLPTEAEWEYAFRSGTRTDLYNGDLESCDGPSARLSEIAWYGKNSDARHHAVRTKEANAWGLYDMAGNVFEWCHDWTIDDLTGSKATDPWGERSTSRKAVRGGAYEWPGPRYFRASARRLEEVQHVCHSIGFRLVRTLKSGPL